MQTHLQVRITLFAYTVTYQKLFLLLLGRLIIKAACLNNLVINIEFVSCSLVHGLLDTLLRNEPKDKHRLSLTDTVSTILSLKISMGIPTSE